ncbi:MAG: hypothetical protein MUF83_03310 [Acidimicrobiales bacterium]|jgi:hypothetical protein|nr:hypothetical protein [Acidimicrobiales bacterium]
MGWRDLLRGPAGGWDGTRGRPPSGNGASSFHLVWQAGAGPFDAVEVTLTVDEVPPVRDLHFWALQVSFEDRGRRAGGAHLGLQWYQRHPGHTAVNWGGYRQGGGELAGSASALPSAPANVNTRDFAWEPGAAYRLRVRRAPEGDVDAPPGHLAWRGSVTDERTGEETVVRDLWVPATSLVSPMVWSEVFAPCDARGTSVRWSDARVRGSDGTWHGVGAATVNYQALGDGGCVTTDSSVDDTAWVQRTGTARRTRQGSVLRLG